MKRGSAILRVGAHVLRNAPSWQREACAWMKMMEILIKA